MRFIVGKIFVNWPYEYLTSLFSSAIKNQQYNLDLGHMMSATVTVYNTGTTAITTAIDTTGGYIESLRYHLLPNIIDTRIVPYYLVILKGRKKLEHVPPEMLILNRTWVEVFETWEHHYL